MSEEPIRSLHENIHVLKATMVRIFKKVEFFKENLKRKHFSYQRATQLKTSEASTLTFVRRKEYRQR